MLSRFRHLPRLEGVTRPHAFALDRHRHARVCERRLRQIVRLVRLPHQRHRHRVHRERILILDFILPTKLTKHPIREFQQRFRPHPVSFAAGSRSLRLRRLRLALRQHRRYGFQQILRIPSRLIHSHGHALLFSEFPRLAVIRVQRL